MSKYVIARQLVGKLLITLDGFELGKFVDAEISEVTGKMNTLLVEPTLDGGIANKMKIDEGVIRVPYAAVKQVNDFIMVDRKELF